MAKKEANNAGHPLSIEACCAHLIFNCVAPQTAAAPQAGQGNDKIMILTSFIKSGYSSVIFKIKQSNTNYL